MIHTDILSVFFSSGIRTCLHRFLLLLLKISLMDTWNIHIYTQLNKTSSYMLPLRAVQFNPSSSSLRLEALSYTRSHSVGWRVMNRTSGLPNPSREITSSVKPMHQLSIDTLTDLVLSFLFFFPQTPSHEGIWCKLPKKILKRISEWAPEIISLDY